MNRTELETYAAEVGVHPRDRQSLTDERLRQNIQAMLAARYDE